MLGELLRRERMELHAESYGKSLRGSPTSEKPMETENDERGNKRVRGEPTRVVGSGPVIVSALILDQFTGYTRMPQPSMSHFLLVFLSSLFLLLEQVCRGAVSEALYRVLSRDDRPVSLLCVNNRAHRQILIVLHDFFNASAEIFNRYVSRALPVYSSAFIVLDRHTLSMIFFLRSIVL